MNGLVKVLVVSAFFATLALAAEKPTVKSTHAPTDIPLTTDPTSVFWRVGGIAYLEKDTQGKEVPDFRTEVRMRWTKDNLYFLFICPYDELYLKPSPNAAQETYELWNWDVAEVFISSSFTDIKRYQEFEVSPQGEWVDLDIDLNKPHHETGWKWNSEFEKIARIDSATKHWYAAIRIPLSAIDQRPAKAGNTFRMNLFLSEGAPSKHHEVTWQSPMNSTFHTPERFGLLKLVDKK